MYSALTTHIAKFVSLDETETEILRENLVFLSVKKKENLLEAGQTCHYQYFIVKGLCRNFIINEKGNEQTTQFGIENWWLSDYLSFHNDRPSGFYIQAVENSELIAIEKKAMETLLAKVPKLERYFRLVLQKAFGASQIRIKYLFTQSAEERYRHFSTSFPEFVQRVPQYMLASYLDFSPEFMSKIRAGKV
ncbi:MAG TPA: Crp/Fnr family transcriptional regulator [Flavobacterium sp.]|nr:Crp/Fnr family transcriptional regulator [Flavobacterium sp.]